ncbi:ABC transporter permease [Microbacterium sp. LRZ72]|uniref:ABC transporter permease n=1 Tax=Microbacterium sp. LRZ72 TaxID=2942481 RepID=UPI0029BBD9E8|nr:ABC transporter permease [Microbacterium sp. LRZ72]MDX2375524.1 ABC transporter permease [Microbacterium sp. LRZ72]
MSTAPTTTTTATASPAPAISSPPRANGRVHLSFARLVRSEWIKFTTVRSTWWSIGLVAALSLGLSLLMAASYASFAGGAPAGQQPDSGGIAIQVITFSTVLTQLLAVILGAIAVTGEYSTGMIRSTLTAAPRRIAALLAKALVVGAAMFVISVVVFALAAMVTTPILGANGLDLGDPGSALPPLLGAALYLALMSVMGVGLGFAIRNGPGTLAVGIGIVFVAPILVGFFPRVDDFAWIHDLASFLPSNAGQSLFLSGGMSGNPLDTVPALITIVLWAVAAVIGGSAVLASRDA